MNFLRARWQNLVMANYAVPPALLEPLLPPGTELDYYEGKTFVSLVGFMFLRTRLFGIPIPGFGNFEEINLRFYVVRKEKNELRRGVVFISETVPSAIVAWMANKLYYEHYTAIPTRHTWNTSEQTLSIEYNWKMAAKWNYLRVMALPASAEMRTGSEEEFIFEHYYGYTLRPDKKSQEYKIEHIRWQVHPVTSYSIDCDFSQNFGPAFGFLTFSEPDSVMLAAGSPIAVKWEKRNLD